MDDNIQLLLQQVQLLFRRSFLLQSSMKLSDRANAGKGVELEGARELVGRDVQLALRTRLERLEILRQLALDLAVVHDFERLHSRARVLKESDCFLLW